MFFCWFLPFLYTTSYTISYTTSYVKYTISYVKNTISYIKYTISYTTSYKMCDIVCFCCWFLPFLYTTSYTISYKKVRCRIRYRIKKNSRRYYTISHVKIAKNIRCNSTMSHAIFLQVPGLAFAAGRTGHAPGAPTGPAS